MVAPRQSSLSVHSLPSSFGPHGHRTRHPGSDRGISTSAVDVVIEMSRLDVGSIKKPKLNIPTKASKPAPEVPEAVPHVGTASVGASIFNLSNYTVGAGLLSVPLTFAWTGLGMQALLLSFMALIMAVTGRFLVHTATRTGTFTYQAAMEASIGKKAGTLLNLVIALGTIGSLCAYMILIGDFSSNLMTYFLGWADRRLLIVCLACAVFPLLMLQSLRALRFTSTAAVFCIAYFVLAVVGDGVYNLWANGIPDDLVLFNPSVKIFRALPIAAFSYSCHIIIMPVFSELKGRSTGKMFNIITSSFSCTCIMYILSGAMGFMRFGNQVLPNVLNNYAEADLGATPPAFFVLAQACLLFVIIASYPLIAFSCRLSISGLISNGKAPTTSVTTLRTISTLLLIGSVCIALTVSDVSVVFSLVGSLSSSSVTIIFPALSYIMSSQNRRSEYKAFAVLFLGVLIAVAGTIFSLMDIVA